MQKHAFILLLLNFFIKSTANQPTSYDLYKQFLDQYKRPITILEIDPGITPMALALAHDCDCTCVLLEPIFARELLTLCTQGNEKNVILLTHTLTLNDFIRLGECEHFDVVLLRNTHKICKDNLQELLNAFSNLGDYIFIEDQHLDNTHSKELKQFALTHNYQVYNTSNKNKPIIYLLKRNRTTILRAIWDTKIKPEGLYRIESSFETKKFHHQLHPQPSEWLAGINLNTFLILKGSYPSKKSIRDYLATLKGKHHTDLWLGNLVIQGKEIVFIDTQDPDIGSNFEKQLAKCIAAFK